MRAIRKKKKCTVEITYKRKIIIFTIFKSLIIPQIIKKIFEKHINITSKITTDKWKDYNSIAK
jgi:hypothetical protein